MTMRALTLLILAALITEASAQGHPIYGTDGKDGHLNQRMHTAVSLPTGARRLG
jgi:hypothetical protein